MCTCVADYHLSFPPPPTPTTDALKGWEFVAQENSNTVYRRLYQDTGLYQYKVTGHYDDITAKDYLEVQVSNSFMLIFAIPYWRVIKYMCHVNNVSPQKKINIYL